MVVFTILRIRKFVHIPNAPNNCPNLGAENLCHSNQGRPLWLKPWTGSQEIWLQLLSFATALPCDLDSGPVDAAPGSEPRLTDSRERSENGGTDVAAEAGARALKPGVRELS